MSVADRIRKSIYSDYAAATPSSRKLFQRASEVLAGGVSGNLRAYEPYPIYSADEQGAYFTDVDGNRYLDCFMGNGPLLLGHNPPALTATLSAHSSRSALPLNPDMLVECAELVTGAVPCAERVRFLNTGTEAVMTALRMARAYTRKNRIIKFHGHYHGQHDQVLLALGPTRDPVGDGIPEATAQDMLVLPYGDAGIVEQALHNHDDVAAILLDPAMHAGGLWGSRQDYLEQLRKLATEHRVLLIFDEVITGFRLSLGGAQSYFNVTPDLATYGKALSAGEKLSAVVGRAEVFNVLTPTTDDAPAVFQSGTSNDGSVALASAIGALRAYRKFGESGYQNLEEVTKALADGIAEVFQRHSVPCHVNQLASMIQIFVTEPPTNFETAFAADRTLVSLLYLALIIEGVFLTVPSSDHIYLSFAHTHSDVERALDAIETVFKRFELHQLVA